VKRVPIWRRAMRGRSVGYGERGRMSVSMWWGGGAFMQGQLRQGSLWGRSFCPKCLLQMSVVWSTLMSVIVQIWTSDNLWSSYSNLATWTWSQSAIFGIPGRHTWTTPHVAGPHSLHTLRYLPKTEFDKTPPGGGILLPVLTLTPSILRGPSYASSRKISAKSDNRRSSYSNLTKLPFGANFGGPFVPTDLTVVRTHPNPFGTMKYAHHRSLTSFFRFPKKSSSSKWRALNRSGIEIWFKIWHFLPPVKNRGGWGNFCRLLWSSSRAPSYGMKTMGVPLAVLHL